MSKIQARIRIYNLTFIEYSDWKLYLTERAHTIEVIDFVWAIIQDHIDLYDEYARIGILAKNIQNKVCISYPEIERYQYDDEWMDFFECMQLLAIDII